MANSLETSLLIKARTEGAAQIDALASEVKRLGTESQATAPKLNPIAEGVQRIGREAGVGRQAQALGEVGQAAATSATGVRTLDGALSTLPARFGPIAGLVAGAFATTQIIGFAQALAPVADAAKNLEGRLRLAVGANGDLASAIERVRESANDAGVGINSVGELYGRIAASSKELGADQARVAELTDTINKSFAVSGSTAAATAGAITQLAQAFASGALRGDEFNSVSEAAPRLMQALADGLGKTRGELRAMAEQGELTSEKVLGALESQRDAINRDFAVLPETIGRATQRLANEWQVFIGELDKTTGASDAVVGGLNLVASHLDDIAGAALTAGEVVTAALAVKAAAALRGYVTLTAASTAATTAQAAALTGLAAAGQAATGAMLMLGRALPGLAVAGVVAGIVALVAEFFRAKSAAEAADEAVRTMLESTPANNAAQQIRLVATEAEAARFKLTEMEIAFAALRAKGDDAAAALVALAKAANIDSSDGIATLITGLDQLRAGAQVTGEQIETALAERLRKLSAADLADFGTQAEIAFNRGALSAEQFGVALDSQARAALLALGVDADAALSGMSKKFREASGVLEVVVGHFDRVKATGTEASAVLAQSIDAAIKAARNPVELEKLVGIVQSLGKEGKLAGDQVGAALDAIARKADQATPGINSVAEAFRELRVTSDAELQAAAERARTAFDIIKNSGTATARDIQTAFAAYAEKAIAANGGIVDATLQAEAAQNGLRLAADEAGNVIVLTMGQAAAAIGAAGDKADELAAKFGAIKSGAEDTAEMFDRWQGNLDKSREGDGRSVAGKGSWAEWAPQDLRDAMQGKYGAAAQKGVREWSAQKNKEFKQAQEEKARKHRENSGGSVSGQTQYRAPGAGAQAPGVGVTEPPGGGQRPGLPGGNVGSGSYAPVTTHRVEIVIRGGTQAAINVAHRSDADALVGILRELEMAQRVAAV